MVIINVLTGIFLLISLSFLPTANGASTNQELSICSARFDVQYPATRHLDVGAIHCYEIHLRAGEYLQFEVSGVGASALVELWLPGVSDGAIQYGLGYGRGELQGSSQTVTAVAAKDGAHLLTIGPVLDGTSLPYRIEIIEHLDREEYTERLQQQARSDQRVAWLREHATSIAPPSADEDDFSDLEPLKQALADVKIVMLGEATHGDAPTYLAKTRLVKFLHQEMGFSVLALENDLYSTWRVWQEIEQGNVAGWDSAFMYGMYNVREFQPLLEYLATQAVGDDRLKLSGLDPHVGWVANHFLKDLEREFTEAGVEPDGIHEFVRVRDTLLDVHGTLEEHDGFVPTGTLTGYDVSAFGEDVAVLQQVIKERMGDDTGAAFWIQVLDGAPNWLDRVISFAALGSMPPSKHPNPELEDPDRNWCIFQNKDGKMAENMLWLTEERHPGQKIIVWAHTGHLYRQPQSITPPGIHDSTSSRCLFQYTRRDDFTVMGHDVYERLGDSVYAIGVVSYEGWERGGPINRHQVAGTELERLFYLAGHEYAFLDMRSLEEDGNWLHERNYARTGPHRAYQARWPAVLDGFLFIRETRPSERVAR